MQTMDDKQAFARRLRQALKRSSKKIETSADLAVQFSLRPPGIAITTQSAHKWLTGQSRPTPDKLKILAALLDVSPTWLLYGEESGAGTATRVRENLPIVPTPDELKMIGKVRSLPEARRVLVQEIIDMCLLDAEVWRGK